MHIFWYVCWSFLWQGTIACWIFSPEKKVHIATQIFRPCRYIFKAFSSCLSIRSFLKVLLWRLCFSKKGIFSAPAFICFWSLESRTSSTHPQFATAYFLSWMPCYRCKQRITIIGLQTYSNILIEGILLKMLRNKRELYLEQAIWFYFVWPVHFALLTQTRIHLHA